MYYLSFFTPLVKQVKITLTLKASTLFIWGTIIKKQ